MKTSAEILEAIRALYEETDAIRAIPEEDVCTLYNVDSRDEILALIGDERKDLEEEYERALEREAEEDAYRKRLASLAWSGLSGTRRLMVEMGF
ncbi:MAG: hypothetical protein LBC19_13660 [Tannerella sp.]|jgi:hypothetical protein|nr:hypothetical protein [Tannerella sp.]